MVSLGIVWGSSGVCSRPFGAVLGLFGYRLEVFLGVVWGPGRAASQRLCDAACFLGTSQDRFKGVADMRTARKLKGCSKHLIGPPGGGVF